MKNNKKTCDFYTKKRQKIEFDSDFLHENENVFVCYTDGSCDNLNEPYIGGAAYIVLKNGDLVKTKSRSFVKTTNNRMEMLAIISAVYSCPDNSEVHIYSDSKYAINVLSGIWKHKKNPDLYYKYIECSQHLKNVRFFWVKGHNGDKYNELADELAYGAYCSKCKELGIIPSGRH